MTNFAWAYVAAVFAAAVWLARRCGAILPWRIAALFYLLVLAFLFRPLAREFVDFPADLIRIIPPWRAIDPIDRSAVSNYELQDVPMQMVPWAHQVRSAYRSLRFPLWNDLAGCGYPLLGNAQSAPFSPIRIAALPVPMPYAMAAEEAMKLLVAMTFTFLLCRRRYGELAGVVGAISFGFASYLVVWAHFPHATVAAFLPAAMLGAELVIENPTRRRIAFAAVAWAATIFGGHPETIADSALLILAFVMWLVFAEGGAAADPTAGRRARSRGAPLFGILGTFLLAIVIASPFIIPVAETLVRSKRFGEVVGRAAGVPYSDAPSLALLVQPRFYGALLRPRAWGPAAAESICGFAGILGFAGFGAAIAGAIRRRSWRERELFFAAAAILIVLVLADWSPVLLPFSTNSRVRVLLCFCAAMLAAALIEKLHERKRESLIGVAFALLALAYPFWVWRSAFQTFDSLLLPLLSIVPSTMVLAFAAFGWRLLIPIGVVAELWIAMHGWNAVRPSAEAYWRTPLIRRLEGLRSLQREPFRIAGMSESLFPNTGVMYGLEDVRVHDPMANGRYVSWLQRHTRYDATSYYAKLPLATSRLLGSLNVRYLAVDPGATVPTPDRYRTVYEGNDGRILENLDFLPRFHAFDSSARVEILRAEATDYRLRVTAAQPALIASSNAAWPGWHVTGANGPIVIDGAFLGFRALAGTSEVRIHYFPLTFYLPLALSLLACAGVGFMIRARV